MQTMWQFTIGRFTIRASIADCHDLALNWIDDSETRDKLESGEYEAFDVQVTVSFNGAVIGRNALHGSIYSDPREFFTDHRSADPMNRNCSLMRAAHGDNVSICHYFPDMVSEAIAEARQWMRDAGLKAAA